MKFLKIIFLFIFLFLITSKTFSHEEPAKTLKEKKDKEKESQKVLLSQIKSSVVYKYFFKDNIISEEKYKYIESEYNEAGYIKSVVFYDSTGAVDKKVIYEYDENNNMIIDADYDSKGVLKEKIIYSYDENGLVTGAVNMKEDKTDSRFVYVRNLRKNSVDLYKYNIENVLEYKIDYLYYGQYENSILIEVIKYVPGKDTLMRVEYNYYPFQPGEHSGRVKEKVIFGNDNFLMHKFEYKYTESGNIETIKKILPDNKIELTQKYNYDESNNIKQVVVYNPDSLIISKTTYTYYVRTQPETSDIFGIIGNTPLVEIDGIYAKLETVNPGGSIKDRLAAYLIQKAEERGELKPGQEIIEFTSGNTGVAFSMICAIKGYKFTAVMPEHRGIEKQKIMKIFGANLILTPEEEDFQGALKKYNELLKEKSEAWFPNQFENTNGPEEHRTKIGQEIIRQMNGQIDAFVAGVGTGGTLIGIAKALKEINPDVKIIAVEPEESPVLSGGKFIPHRIEGIGESFIPDIIKENRHLIDEIILIKSEDAIKMAVEIIQEHGFLVGITSGANVLAAKEVNKKYKRVVTILPDRGERYLDIYLDFISKTSPD